VIRSFALICDYQLVITTFRESSRGLDILESAHLGHGAKRTLCRSSMEGCPVKPWTLRLCASLICILGLGLTAMVGSEKNSSEQEVLAATDRLSSAGLHRDVTALKTLYSDDYFHTNPDGSVMTREEVLASYVSPTLFHFDSSEASSVRAITRGTFAVVNQILTLHGEKEGAGEFTARYRVTFVLERQRTGWKFVNSHSSLLGIDPEAGK
jgi:ketosteroid isomerase-like protein